jgi:nucleoside-diphosphate-sugar epimerase
MTDVVAVTGAAGFIGRALIAELAGQPEVTVRALQHRRGISIDGVEAVPGDIRDPSALRTLLTPGCRVVDLVPSSGSPADVRREMAAFARVCLEAGVARVVHGSTAVVVGRSSSPRIDERSPCAPRTAYERAKLAAEDALEQTLDGRCPLLILRPTAVFGPGGRNLAKLMSALTSGRRAVNHLRSSVFGRRRSHLVPLQSVVAALHFLLRLPGPATERFIVSRDDAAANNFRDVETILMDALGIDAYRTPRLPIPAAGLSLALRLRGRSVIDPNQVFDDGRIRRAGFEHPVGFEEALRLYARHWLEETVPGRPAGA